MSYLPIGRRGIVAILMLMVGLAASIGRTQEFRQYREYDRYRYLPRLPQGPENPEPLPVEEKELTGSPKVLVDKLDGLLFVDDPDQVVVTPPKISGVQIHSEANLSLLNRPSFRRITDEYLGRPVSVRRLNELVREIIRYYRRNNRPVVDVSIPEQDITGGVVQIVVIEARVGKVIVKGARYFDNGVLLNQVWTGPGQRIYESRLLSDVRWLIRDPFRDVELELSPGDERGLTDITYNVTDQPPVRGYLGYEDTGTRPTGIERTFYGANWNNALWRDDDVGYQFTASSDFESLEAHSAFYSTALSNRDILTVYGAYANFEGSILGLPANNGRAWQILGRWYRELCHTDCHQRGVTAGFDYKRTNTNLEFGGTTVLQSDVDIFNLMGGYNSLTYDRLGSWTLGIDGYYSPGNVGGRNDSADLQQLRAFAKAHYFYTRGFFERVLELTQNFDFVFRITGQWASGNLVPTEQLGFGGYNSIRGYDQYSIVGDSGYFSNLEIRTKPYSPGFLTFCQRGQVIHDQLVLLGFYDLGDSLNHRLLPGEDGSIDLQSVGVGLRYQAQPRLTLRTDYGWQLVEVPTLPNTRQRWHIGAVFSY